MKTARTIHASSIETTVISPSKSWVTWRTGIRSRAGNGPKYMKVRPSMTNPSMPITKPGTSRWPSRNALACASKKLAA